MENNYAMIIAAAILLLFLVYKEVKRVNKQRLPLRLIAVLAASAALVLIMFPLKYKSSKPAKTGQLHLLSAGAEFSSLKDAVYYTTDSAVLLNKEAKGVRYLPDLDYYLQNHQEISQVHVYGYGLQQTVLDKLEDHTFSFAPAPLPSGIISCSWPAVIKQTELLQVQGTFNNTSNTPVKLILNGLGTKRDSLSVAALKTVNFSLKDRPVHLGRALYSLIVLKGADTIVQEKVPFQVMESPKIKLLVLSSFPDFEYKFLKNWLYENKYQVVFRTRISKDKFSVDQLNTAAVNVDELHNGMLSKFDAVIADDEELSKLSAAGISSLQSAINGGLGLLIRIGEEKTASVFGKQLKLYTTADSAVKSFTPVFVNEKIPLQALPVNQSLYLQPRSADRPLVRSQAGKTLVSSSLSGNGMVTVSLITATYPWILSGKPADYAGFWSQLISNTLRKKENQLAWETIPALPVIRQQTQFIYKSENTDSVPQLSLGKLKLNLSGNVILPYAAETTFWPQQTGWNELATAQKAIGYLYIYGKTDWTAANQYQTLLQNTDFAKKHKKNREDTLAQAEVIEKEISTWWFFALFLLSAGYIWFETKLL